MTTILSTILAIAILSFVTYGTFFRIKWFDKLLNSIINKAINCLKIKH